MKRLLTLWIILAFLVAGGTAALAQTSGTGTHVTTETGPGTFDTTPAITYSHKCTFDSADDQDFGDGDTIEGASEGCEIGTLEVVEAAGNAVAVSSNKLSLTQDGDSDVTECGVYNTDAFTRTLGGVMRVDVTCVTDVNDQIPIGLKDDAAFGSPDLGIWIDNSDVARYKTENTLDNKWQIPTFVADAEKKLAILTGGANSAGKPYVDGDTKANFTYGASFFYYDGSNWKLACRRSSAVDDDAVYPMYIAYTASKEILLDNFIIADPSTDTEEDLLGKSPALLAMHSFGEDSDTDDTGASWNDEGNTWTIAAGAITNAPTLGSELLTNGDFSSWSGDDPQNWTVSGESGSDPELCEVATGEAHANCGTPGGGMANFYSSATHNTPDIRQSVLTANTWTQGQITIDTMTDASFECEESFFTNVVWSTTGTKTFTGRGTNTNFVIRGNAASLDVTVDDASAKTITTNTLFYSVDSGDDDVFISAEVTMDNTYDTAAGVVLGMDSQSSPTDYIVAFYNMASPSQNDVALDKMVGGTLSNVVNDTAETYSAGAPITVIKDGGTAYIFYNNKLLDSGDVSDPGLVNNTIHGLFSTHSSNSFDNVLIQALGSDGEYANLNNY